VKTCDQWIPDFRKGLVGNLAKIQVNTKKYHVFAPMGRFQLESTKILTKIQVDLK
jgi:hypothetical protein